jgi:hypothetical protein
MYALVEYRGALPRNWRNISGLNKSAKVFRQITLGNWAEPFGIIKEKLKCYMHTLKMAP